MVAPLLAVLGLGLGGAKLRQMVDRSQQSMKIAEEARQRGMYAASMERAQGVADPLAGGDSAQRFGLSLLEDPLTAQSGLSILNQAMDRSTTQAGQALTERGQNITLRGQDFDQEYRVKQAEAQLAQFQQQAQQQQRAQANERESRLQTVRNDIQPLVAPLVKASGLMRSALNAPEGFAGDSVLIRNFAQQLNPVGVLSDSDVAAVGNDPSIPQVIANIITKVSEGKLLTPLERGKIRQAAAGLYKENRNSAMTLAGPVLTTSDRLGFPRGEVFDESALMDDATLQPFLDYQPPAAPVKRVPIRTLEEANERLRAKGMPELLKGEDEKAYRKRTGETR